MTRFEVMQEMNEVTEYASEMYKLALKAGSAAMLEVLLNEEVTEDQFPEEQETGQIGLTSGGHLGYAVNARYKRLEKLARERESDWRMRVNRGLASYSKPAQDMETDIDRVVETVTHRIQEHLSELNGEVSC